MFSILGFIKRLFGRKRDLLLVVGSTFSGKTSLLYRVRCLYLLSLNLTPPQLALKRNQATVTSYQPNEVVLRIEYFDHNRKKSATLKAIDVPGQGHFRQQIQQRFPEVLGVLVIIDSSGRQGQAGEILYDVLNSGIIRRQMVPVLIVCNKQDQSDARKAPQLEKELESEMCDFSRAY